MTLLCRQDTLTVTLACDFIAKCVNMTVVTNYSRYKILIMYTCTIVIQLKLLLVNVCHKTQSNLKLNKIVKTQFSAETNGVNYQS